MRHIRISQNCSFTASPSGERAAMIAGKLWNAKNVSHPPYEIKAENGKIKHLQEPGHGIRSAADMNPLCLAKVCLSCNFL